MKLLGNIIFSFVVLTFLTVGSVYSEDLNTIMNEFYDGLADIIERNMNNPDQCVREVELYYIDNQDAVKKIKAEMKKAASKAKAAMEKYGSEHESMSQKYETQQAQSQPWGLQAKNQGKKGVAQPAESQTGEGRYSKALQAFSKKYPQQGLKIAMKVMELMPK